jgi:FkbM family methyltransferase
VRVVDILLDPGALRALATWPKFSLTSFKMMTGLARQGIIPNTVIDVGANVGQFAVAAAMTFPGVVVHSFEPLPEAAAVLQKNVGKLDGVKVYPVAIGEREGECTFHRNMYSHASSVLPLTDVHRRAFPTARDVETISVEITTLDRVFADVPLRPPVLLKLDVQGYEEPALKGAVNTLKRCDYAVVEASFKPLYEGEASFTGLLSLMRHFGFSFMRPVGWLCDPGTGEILQADALFGRVPTENGRNGGVSA